MNQNDILRRLRYTLNYTNEKIAQIFELSDLMVNQAQVVSWLKREDDNDFVLCDDLTLSHFLAGLIIEKRGKSDGKPLVVEKELNNNLILRKLKIAFDLKSEDCLEILSLVDFRLGKSELSAFFRHPDHKHYRDCQDQILRNFMSGLQKKYRPS